MANIDAKLNIQVGAYQLSKVKEAIDINIKA